VPVWHEKTKAWVEQGKLVVLGIIQEQHPQRCRLFAQWKQIDWPILIDPINVVGCSGVPIAVAIDEHGVVRSTRPNVDTFERDFLEKTFPPPSVTATDRSAAAEPANLAALERLAKASESGDAWRRLGDGVALFGGIERIDDAIDAYSRAIRMSPKDGDAHFRLGACYRTRYDSPRRKANDFQAAADCWSAARRVDPNRYIWRRRIEQYGPRLIKPYPFYDWVPAARAEIAARGERPVALDVALSGAEIARPSREFRPSSEAPTPPDPQGRIHRDSQGLVAAEVAVVPARIPPGGSARVHVTLRPASADVHWNNEADPLLLWIDPPAGWQVERQLLTAPGADEPETAEPRRLEFEVRAPAGAAGTVELPAYALYHVCEEEGGACLFLRQDVAVKVRVAE